MRVQSGRARRSLAAGTVAGVVLSVGLAAAGPARAAGVVATTVTSITELDGTPYPANALLVENDGAFSYDTMKVTGTSASSAGGTQTTLELRCYFDDTSLSGFNTLKTGVTPTASGAWTAYVDPYLIYGHRCRVRAVPTAYNNVDVSAYPAFATTFSGIYASIEYWGFDNPSGHAPYYYTLSGYQGSTYVHELSASDAGLADTSLSTSTTNLQTHGASVWADAASFIPHASAEGSIPDRSSLEVDGHPAYDGREANLVNANGPGQPVPTMAISIDPASGVLVTTESSDLVSCVNAGGQAVDVPVPSPSQCPQFRSTGVRFTRVSTTSATGDVTAIRDSFASTDGAAHAVDWMYVDYTNAQDLELPGQTSFAAVTAGQEISTAAWPISGTELVRTAGGGTTGDPGHPIGAIAYSAKPAEVAAFSAQIIYQRYARTVPAGRSATVTRSLVTAPTVSAASAAAATALAGKAPVLTLNPLAATIGTRQVVVSGKIAPGSNGLPDAVTANGISGPVAADGTFSTLVELTPGPGPKVIAVAGTDFVGAPFSSQVSTTYANPVTSSAPKLVKTKSASGKVVKAKLTVPVSCASFGPMAGCRAVVKLGAKGKLLASTRTVVVGRGKTTAVVLSLSASARAKLNRLAAGKHLFANLQVIYADAAGGTLPLKVRSVKLA